MPKTTPEQLDIDFPDRHQIAEAIGLHPDLRDGFIPFPPSGQSMSAAQIEAAFPKMQRDAFVTGVVRAAHTPDLGPQCSGCQNLKIDCICDQLGAAS